MALLGEKKVKDRIHKRFEGPWGKLEGTCWGCVAWIKCPDFK